MMLEPANAKNSSGLREHALVVRPSMGERLHHFANAPFGRRRVRADYAANAAHRVSLLSRFALGSLWRFALGFAPRCAVGLTPHGARVAQYIRRKAPLFPPEAAPNSSPRATSSTTQLHALARSPRRSIDGGREPTLRIRAR